MSDPLVGQRLDGRYRVRALVARGGMGLVYEALDERLDRAVAVKVMHPWLAQDPEFVARFTAEARSAARLSHPNIVAVHDQGRDGALVWLVMEYVHGRTLRDLLDERGVLSPAETVALLEPVLDAIAAAHTTGIVHRDVKPANVLLADDGRIKVADFGLARATSGATSITHIDGGVLGSVSYLAPELVARGIADARADVYAVGIMAFEMLTGKRPFVGESQTQIAFAHVHHDVPHPRSLRSDVPGALDALVVRATRRDPDARPVDGRQFLIELRAAAAMAGQHPNELTVMVTRAQAPAGEPTAFVPAPSGPFAPPATAAPRRRSRRRVRLLSTLLVLALAGAAYWFGPGRYTTAPSLPATAAAAQARAEAQHFHVVQTRQADDGRQAGEVIRVSPAPGRWVRRGATITLTVSTGPVQHAVPHVAGKDQAAAEAALSGAHLSVGAVSRGYSETVPSGSVIGSDPAEGEQRPTGASVALVVSRGVPPSKVPKLVGLPLDKATGALAAVRLTIRTTQAYDDHVAQGAVVSQSARAGTGLPRGSSVAVVLSQGPPPVDVPQVVDMHRATAVSILEAAGFQVRVRGSRVLDRVFNQSPNGGGQAPRGSTITIFTV